MQRPQARCSTHSCCLVAQSCPLFCDPMDYSPPGSSVRGILQARVLEWVAFPSPVDLLDAGIKPRSFALSWILYPLSHGGSPTHIVDPQKMATFLSLISPTGWLNCLVLPSMPTPPPPKPHPQSQWGIPFPHMVTIGGGLLGGSNQPQKAPPPPPGAHGVRCRGCPQKVACPESQAQQSLWLPLATAPAPGEPVYLQHLGRARAAHTARAGRALDED